LNILLLVSYVVMIALYAYAFGSYAANALGTPVLKSFLIALVLILFAVLNSLGAVVSGRAEDLLVAFKLAVLVIVAAAGLAFVNPERLMLSNWADAVSTIAGGMITFLEFKG
jgi:amino acid transporter